MYSKINQHIDLLLPALDNHVAKYCELRQLLYESNVAENHEFQRKYKYFWAMNVARLHDTFIQEYFQQLEESKNTAAPSVKVVSERLYQFPTRADRTKKSLQFSFSSKLVHMIDPTRPVYDRLIERFYFLPSASKSGLERLPSLMSSYSFLESESRRIIDLGLLDSSVKRFRARFKDQSLSDQKVIDSLIWQFTSLLISGAVQSHKVVYL